MTVLNRCASAYLEIVRLAAKDATDCRRRGHVSLKFLAKYRQPSMAVTRLVAGSGEASQASEHILHGRTGLIGALA